MKANPANSSVIVDQQQLVSQQPQINHISPQHQQQQQQIVNQNYQNYLQVSPAAVLPTFPNQVVINVWMHNFSILIIADSSNNDFSF